MTEQLALGAILIFLSIVVQASFIGGLIWAIERSRSWLQRPPESLRASIAIGIVALWLMTAHTIAIWLWAIAFYGLGVFGDLETSVYFSAVAFTTLGFGDIIPPQAWRQLAGLCAANGLLVFGVSAAVLVETYREIRAPSRR